ncbi:MAG: nitroreductase family protein [Actinomycetota bacterium]
MRRRLDLERPVADELIEQCLGLALQAPNASNEQTWYWVIVTDESKRRALADLYRRSLEPYLDAQTKIRHPAASRRLLASVRWLAEHLQDVPVHVIPCIQAQPMGEGSNHAASSFYGSILPAVWSFQLALRSRGLGSAWTTSHLTLETEAAEVLAIPADVVQVAMVPVAHLVGDDLHPAPRRPVAEVTYWNGWGWRRSH